MPEIPATWEVEVGETPTEAGPGKSEKLYMKKKQNKQTKKP
jgi:hypothetical protein